MITNKSIVTRVHLILKNLRNKVSHNSILFSLIQKKIVSLKLLYVESERQNRLLKGHGHNFVKISFFCFFLFAML